MSNLSIMISSLLVRARAVSPIATSEFRSSPGQPEQPERPEQPRSARPRRSRPHPSSHRRRNRQLRRNRPRNRPRSRRRPLRTRRTRRQLRRGSGDDGDDGRGNARPSHGRGSGARGHGNDDGHGKPWPATGRRISAGQDDGDQREEHRNGDTGETLHRNLQRRTRTREPAVRGAVTSRYPIPGRPPGPQRSRDHRDRRSNSPAEIPRATPAALPRKRHWSAEGLPTGKTCAVRG